MNSRPAKGFPEQNLVASDLVYLYIHLEQLLFNVFRSFSMTGTVSVTADRQNDRDGNWHSFSPCSRKIATHDSRLLSQKQT